MAHDSSPGSSDTTPGGPPSWLGRLLEHLQDLGVSPSVVERFVNWWRRYGLVKTLVLTMAVLWPVMRFQVLPAATSSYVESVAEAEGLRLTVDDWTLSLADFSGTARGVVVETRGPYREPYLFRADAIEVDASFWQNVSDGTARLWRRTGNLIRRLTWREALPMPPRPIGRSIIVTGGRLYLERLISGRGNWQDTISRTRPPGFDADEVEPYFVPQIELNDFTITYLEHLAAEPGSGLEQSLTSTLHLDEGTLTLGDFVGPADDRVDPTDFSLDGRVGDGRVSMTGAFNLWAASFNLDISLSNVGAATLGVMSPEASIVPASGTMTGHIAVAVRDDEMQTCEVNVQFRDVRYRPNPRSPFTRTRQPIILDELEQVLVTAVIQTPCTGNWRDPQFRPMWAVQSSMNARALQDGPPAVQSAVRFDQRRFAEALSPEAVQAELVRAGDELTRQIGQQIGEQTGNAVTRGLKSVGRGIGRVFGRKPKS